MKIGLIGKGFVGEALYQSFSKRGQEVIAYDKFKQIGTFEDVLDAEIIFLCLPTPFIENFGYDLSSIHDVCQKLAAHRYQKAVVLKSTVEPGTTVMLAQRYGLNLIYNPEFLTQRTAAEDFDQQKHIVIGEIKSKVRELYYQGIHTPLVGFTTLLVLYQDLYPEAQISVSSATEAEAMKLFCNNFYAMKVQIFNEFYLLCQRVGIDYELVKKMMLGNGWINEMHTKVPGPDGKLSYGGACFKKDTNALRIYMKRQNVPHKVLEATITERNEMRKD